MPADPVHIDPGVLGWTLCRAAVGALDPAHVVTFDQVDDRRADVCTSCLRRYDAMGPDGVARFRAAHPEP